VKDKTRAEWEAAREALRTCYHELPAERDLFFKRAVAVSVSFFFICVFVPSLSWQMFGSRFVQSLSWQMAAILLVCSHLPDEYQQDYFWSDHTVDQTCIKTHDLSF
jgi:hypothetical protein